MTKPYTEDEVRDNFISQIIFMIEFWETANRDTWREKMEGLAFSILVMLDGEHGDMPGFKVIPNPHPDDRKFHQSRGEKWYPAGPAYEVDIGGCLHERWHPILRELGIDND